MARDALRFVLLGLVAVLPMTASAALLGTPVTSTTVGAPYYFKPTLTNANPKTVKYYIQGKPRWLAYNQATGALSGTPTATGTWSGIKLMSWDGVHGAALGPFSITVKAASNSSVKISGTPASSIEAGSYFSFRPTVSAPAGARLTFSITSKPAWASFNTTNGTLSGTPSASNVAKFSNIAIKVTDSKTSATTPAFAITVTKASTGNGNALLSWIRPSKNTDGSALTNLAGYRIHYGTSLSSLGKQLTVGGSGTTSASIEGLGAGTWYFAVVAYTTAGIESAMSATASKIIR